MPHKDILKIVAIIVSFLFLVVTAHSVSEGKNMEMDSTSITQSKLIQIEGEPITHIREADKPDSENEEISFNPEDEEILLQIGMAEAESEGVEGIALVMLVVNNRVFDKNFPDSIQEVVFQEGTDGKKQFAVMENGGRYFTTEPDENCYEALELVKSGWDESEGALYFESCKQDSWHKRNLEFLFQEGNHRFYK